MIKIRATPQSFDAMKECVTSVGSFLGSNLDTDAGKQFADSGTADLHSATASAGAAAWA
jgi:hypothetical protein